MLTKNQIYEADVTDYTSEGQGVAHVEGCAIFIPNAIQGERYRIRLTKVGKTWAAGKIEEILEKSPHRVPRACPQGKLCGGCDFQHMDYTEELRLKAERVRGCLNRLGGEALEKVEILGAPSIQGYRNKAQYPVASREGQAVAGFFKAGTHQVVPISRCGILPEEMDRAKDAVLNYMNQVRVSVYDEATGKGLVRHIYVRKAFSTGEVMVCVVANGDKLPQEKKLLSLVREKVPNLRTLVLSVNNRRGNTVLGSEFRILYGPGYIEDILCGLRFRLSPQSFYQVNHDQAERLYKTAIRAAEITKMDTVLDLYCGAGTITLAMAAAAGKVIGVEIVPEAVEDAKGNARRNGIQNAEFFCGDAGQAALELEKRGLRPDVVTVDPPRKGLCLDVIEAVAKMSPKRLVYISCDPATLARDVGLLKERGFRLQSATALDLFPRCAHVETCVLLRYQGAREYVHVAYEPDNADYLRDMPGNASYREIKKWIQQEYGMMVSSLYVAQVKRKHGIIERENYNTGKDGHKVPQCPPEKEQAIEAALKHFKMI